jgi:hypothetical protein
MEFYKRAISFFTLKKKDHSKYKQVVKQEMKSHYITSVMDAPLPPTDKIFHSSSPNSSLNPKIDHGKLS